MTRKLTTVVRRRRTRNKKGGMKKRMRGGTIPTLDGSFTMEPTNDSKLLFKQDQEIKITLTNNSVLKFKIHSIYPDGNCLFAAVGMEPKQLLNKTQQNEQQFSKKKRIELANYASELETDYVKIPENIKQLFDSTTKKYMEDGDNKNFITNQQLYGGQSEIALISQKDRKRIITFDAIDGNKIYDVNIEKVENDPIYILRYMERDQSYEDWSAAQVKLNKSPTQQFYEAEIKLTEHYDLLIPQSSASSTPNTPPLSSSSPTSQANPSGWLGWLASFLPDPAAIPTSGEPYNLVISVDADGKSFLQVYTPQIGTVANAENFIQAITNDKPMFKKPIKVNIDTTGKMSIIPDSALYSSSVPTTEPEAKLAAIPSADEDANTKAATDAVTPLTTKP